MYYINRHLLLFQNLKKWTVVPQFDMILHHLLLLHLLELLKYPAYIYIDKYISSNFGVKCEKKDIPVVPKSLFILPIHDTDTREYYISTLKMSLAYLGIKRTNKNVTNLFNNSIYIYACWPEAAEWYSTWQEVSLATFAKTVQWEVLLTRFVGDIPQMWRPASSTLVSQILCCNAKLVKEQVGFL